MVSSFIPTLPHPHAEGANGMGLPSMTRIPLAMIIQGTREEIAAFLHKQSTANQSSFELFRRALVLRDEAAWVGLYQVYHALVESWILRRALAGIGDHLESLVNATFAKFARAITVRDLRADHYDRCLAVVSQVLCGLGRS